jgi:hypothetical protein
MPPPFEHHDARLLFFFRRFAHARAADVLLIDVAHSPFSAVIVCLPLPFDGMKGCV